MLPIINRDKRLVLCVVLEPDVIDLDGDYVTVDGVEDAFYTYVKFGDVRDASGNALQQYFAPCDLATRWYPGNQASTNTLRTTQQFLAPCDFIPPGCGPDRTIRAGSWVWEGYVVSDDLWAVIKRCEFDGI